MDKRRILIVEDDVDLAEMLDTYFRVSDYDITTASDGEEALQHASENPLDLVVLDIRLPDIDGFEVCRRLRTQRRTKDTPIIFLTEKSERVDRLHGLQLGVVDYITKPFDIQELKLRIRNAINRAQQPSIANPVTDLPEGPMVDEKLGLLLKSKDEWATLAISLGNMKRFRELYGFVATDDVLRAVTLMVRNAVKAHGNLGDYIAHLGESDFVIITTAGKVGEIRKRLESRITRSRQYFAPAIQKDEKNGQAAIAEKLTVRSSAITHKDGPFATLGALKKSLTDALAEIKDS